MVWLEASGLCGAWSVPLILRPRFLGHIHAFRQIFFFYSSRHTNENNLKKKKVLPFNALGPS